MKLAQRIFSIRVCVPGSSANLGPGFDALGLALALHDEWTVEGIAGGPSLRIEIEGARGIPIDGTNLAHRAFCRVFQVAKRSLPGLLFRLKSRLPVAGGLGSSSAAIVGGLVAANAALPRPLPMERLVDLAVGFEGHPDNVVPALLGGLCAAVVTGGGTRFLSWRAPGLFEGLSAVMAVPNFALTTARARAILPRRIPRIDAIFNTGRAALFVGAVLSRRFDLLADAMEDRLHEPYRRKLIPGFDEVILSAERAGAYGASLSGAGPSILALAPAERASAVARAMTAAFQRSGAQAQAHVLKVDTRGARVVSHRRFH